MGHGGKREGSGRKVGAKSTVMRRVTAEQILAGVDEQGLWNDILELGGRLEEAVTPQVLPDGREVFVAIHPSVIVKAHGLKLDALKYLTDRRDGKAAQPVTGESGKGPVEVRVTIETVGSRNGHGG